MTNSDYRELKEIFEQGLGVLEGLTYYPYDLEEQKEMADQLRLAGFSFKSDHMQITVIDRV